MSISVRQVMGGRSSTMTQSNVFFAAEQLWKVPASLLLISALYGCALSPGLVVHAKTKPVAAVPQDLQAIPITPEVIAELRSERARRADTSPPIANEPPYSYRLGLQDKLHISVWNHPDLGTGQQALNSSALVAGAQSTGPSASNANVTPDRAIDDDGTVYIPLAGKVRAAGLTVAEFRERLSNELKLYIHEPQVEVQVSAFQSQRVFVAGQVRSPGAVPITTVPLYVTDALAQTGGALNDADLTSVKLTRLGISTTLNLDSLYFSGRQAQNLLLRNGDMITVPDRQNQKIFVLGEVVQPRSYVLRRGEVTLAEALADAGGPNATAASTAHIYLLRLDDAGNPLVYHLDARRPEALLLSESMPVQAGDLVVVNPTAVSLVSRLVNQFFPVLSETALIRSLTK